MFLKTATLKEVSRISKLVNSAYRGKKSKMGWTTEADLLGGQRTDVEKIVEMINDPTSQVELLIHHSRIVGCVYLKQEDQKTLYFGMLTIKPLMQNRHLGKKMLKHIEAIAYSKKCSQIRMTVIHLRHELITYYERQGYQKTGKTEDFPVNDPRFGLPKRNDLFFIEMIKRI